MPKVAFLALDDIHHLPHIAPVAFELSRRSDYDCTLFIQAHSQKILNVMAGLYPTHRCHIKILSPPLFTKIKYFFKHKFYASWRVIRDHASELCDYDIFISPDLDMQFLIKKIKKMGKKSSFFVIPHGAGDRFYEGYQTATQDIDLILVSGEKYKILLSDHYHIPSTRCVIIGYPKFDIVPVDARKKIFAHDKPVILYNPHFCQDQSSWYPWGLAILDYFYRQSTFNLIFAPHCNLFKRLVKKRCIPKLYLNCDHIHIDFGSTNSVDMTYTQAADIYMGDVSSQVYEFIRTPRPCIFLNPHQIAWKEQCYYENWRLGTVIEKLEDLWIHLDGSPQSNPYHDKQIQSFQRTFSMTTQSASTRAVDVIHRDRSGTL